MNGLATDEAQIARIPLYQPVQRLDFLDRLWCGYGKSHTTLPVNEVFRISRSLISLWSERPVNAKSMLLFIAVFCDCVPVSIGIKTKLDNADRLTVRHAVTPVKKGFSKSAKITHGRFCLSELHHACRHKTCADFLKRAVSQVQTHACKHAWPRFSARLLRLGWPMKRFSDRLGVQFARRQCLRLTGVV